MSESTEREAHRESSDRQAAASREGALKHVTVLALDQPLLRFLTDAELAAAENRTHRAINDLRIIDGHDAAATYVLATLGVALHNERVRREESVHEARVSLEANGHEVMLVHDEIAERQGEGGYYSACTCDEASYVDGATAVRADAVAWAVQHLTDTEGAWDTEHCPATVR